MLIIQSVGRNGNSINKATDEAANEAASFCRYLEVNYDNDLLFKACIEAVELGQSVKVRIGKNPAKYTKECPECDEGQEKGNNMSSLSGCR